MKPQLAVQLIDEISYKPEWKIRTCEDTEYEGMVLVAIEAEVPNSNREFAPLYQSPGLPSRTYRLDVDNCEYAGDVYALILHCLVIMELHELREFFGVGAAYDKPYHPHRAEGNRAWASRPCVEHSADSGAWQLARGLF